MCFILSQIPPVIPTHARCSFSNHVRVETILKFGNAADIRIISMALVNYSSLFKKKCHTQWRVYIPFNICNLLLNENRTARTKYSLFHLPTTTSLRQLRPLRQPRIRSGWARHMYNLKKERTRLVRSCIPMNLSRVRDLDRPIKFEFRSNPRKIWSETGDCILGYSDQDQLQAISRSLMLNRDTTSISFLVLNDDHFTAFMNSLHPWPTSTAPAPVKVYHFHVHDSFVHVFTDTIVSDMKCFKNHDTMLSVLKSYDSPVDLCQESVSDLGHGGTPCIYA